MIHTAIYYLLIAFVFLFPISTAASNGVLILLVVFWLSDKELKQNIKTLLKDKIFIILMGLVTLFTLSTFFSVVYDKAFLMNSGLKNESVFIIKHFVWLSLFYAIYTTSLNSQNNSKILNAFLVAIFFSECVSYLLFFEVIDAPSFIAHGLLIREASAHSPVPFMHHTFYSFFLSVTILFLLDQLFRFHGSKTKQLVIAVFFSSAIINLFINGGRTGQLALIIGIMIYTTLKFEKKYIVAAIGFLFGVFMLAYNFSPTFKERVAMASSDISKMTQNDFNTSWGARMAVNITACHYLTDSNSNFIFGAGAGQAKKEFITFASHNMPENIHLAIKNLSHLHNQYIQSWVDGSIFSLLLLLLLLYFFIKTATRENRHLVFALAGIIAFSFLSDVILYRPHPYLLVLFVFAYFSLEKRKVPKQTPNDTASSQSSQ